LEMMQKYVSTIQEDYYDKLESVLGILDKVIIPVSEWMMQDKP
jgi:hypothetical protein